MDSFKKNYVFYIEDTLPKPDAAHLVTATQHANAAANLGYPSVFAHIQTGKDAWHPQRWLAPFIPQPPSPDIAEYYNLQSRFQIVSLPVPWPFGIWNTKWTSVSTLVCRYYFPIHIFPKTQLLQTNNWNLVKTAVRHDIPVIYEREHYRKNSYEVDVVNHPKLLAAVTLSDPVRENMIANGMPIGKIIQLHLGFNSSFKARHIEEAAEWRMKLLKENRQYMVVYSGALYKFKGVDLLLDIAPQLPSIAFVFAGGSEEKVNMYKTLANEKKAYNAMFIGYVTHSRLVSLLQAADILVYPHLMGEAATFTSPLKFFEYMASGTPMVCTTIPPLAPFKSANITVSWCQPNDPQSMINAICKTLKKYPRMPNGYHNNMEYVEQFSWENRICKILERVHQISEIFIPT